MFNFVNQIKSARMLFYISNIKGEDTFGDFGSENLPKIKHNAIICLTFLNFRKKDFRKCNYEVRHNDTF